MLANWCTVDKEVSFELLQVRDDICIGKPVYRDQSIIVQGTSLAIRDEARKVFNDMRGEVGEKKRGSMQVLQKEMKHSWESASGESKNQMMRLASLTDGEMGMRK